MPTYHAEVLVATRANVLHPESKTVQEVLHGLGHHCVKDLHIGKHFSFSLAARDEATAKKVIHRMAEQLLANPVIEDTQITQLRVVEAV
jgi:phosphoribosylformylglycinamidine synthase PurS subunit